MSSTDKQRKGGARRGWNLEKTKRVMLQPASEPTTPATTSATTPATWQGWDADDDVWGSSGTETFSIIGRGAKFANVIEACATTSCFWVHLRHVKYVKMMTCVCKHAKRAMEPSENQLPFWGTWTLFMARHPLKSIDTFMHIRREDLKHLRHAEEKIFPYRSNSPKQYALDMVWSYMVQKYGGVENYARDIIKYRKNRETHRRRQVSFVKKNIVVGGEVGIQEDRVDEVQVAEQEQQQQTQGANAKEVKKPRRKGPPSTREEEEKMEREELRREFAIALCTPRDGGVLLNEHGTGGCFSPMAFVTDLDCAAEESACLERRWNMMVRCKEMCELFFSPFHDKSASTFSPYHHSRVKMWNMVVMHFVTQRHMTKIMDLINRPSSLKLAAKKMLVTEETRDLCAVFAMFYGNPKVDPVMSIRRFFASMGNIQDPKIAYSIMSDYDTYHATMEVFTRRALQSGSINTSVDAWTGGELGCISKYMDSIEGILDPASNPELPRFGLLPPYAPIMSPSESSPESPPDRAFNELEALLALPEDV
jgi:hypothetical protein